ncbi:MAG: helix-turn-helix domain-containing protein [Amphritea sp.]
MPSLRLRNFIQSYWTIQRPASSCPLPNQFLHPDGGVSLVFNFGEAWSLDNQNFNSRFLLSGPLQTTSTLRLTGAIDALGIRFLPGMAYPFLQQSLTELQSHIAHPLPLSRRFTLADMAEQLATAASLNDRLAIIEQRLSQRLENAPLDSPAVNHSLRWLNQTKGKQPIQQLVDQNSISQRQLERQFKCRVGMTAKQYSKLQRVANARQLLRKASETEKLSDIAIISGYYDQAHFSREFKAVIGIPPGNFLHKLQS